MRKESRQAVRAVFLAAIMIVSVFAAGIAFSGSAAAEVTEISGVSAENTTAGDANQIENVTLEGVDKTSSGTSDLTATIEGADVSIKSAGLVDSGNFNASNVTVSERNAGGLFVLITGNDTPSGDITIEVTLNTTNADPGTEGTYSVTSVGGASASGDFQIQSDNDGSQSDGVLTVDPDGGTDAYDTIQAAVNNAKSGDTVEVTSGTYEESVTISTEGLTLENAESAEPTVIGQSSVAISVESPSVTISDLTIRNPEGDRGVRATDNATNVKIARNTIEDVGTAGAFTQSRGILVSSLKNGDSASGLEVRNNTVNTIQGTGGNSEQTIGIQILEESNGGGLIENVVVDGNNVTNLLDNRSSQGINFNGNIEGDITNNNISTLNTDRPGEDLGFTQAIALNEGGNAANAPQNVRISGNSISGLDDQTPSTESFRATHIILSSVDDTDSIDIRNNVFIAATSDENYILDRASGDFDLQGALGVNTFEPSVVQVEEGSDRVLVPDTGADVDVVNVDQQTSYDNLPTAIQEANTGDTIEISSGDYSFANINTDGLTLDGAGMNDTTLSGNQLEIDATDVTLQEVTIDAPGNNIRVEPGSEADGLRIENVRVSDNQQTTIGLDISADGDNDTATDRADGLYVENFYVESPSVKGIYLERVNNAVIRDVTVDTVPFTGNENPPSNGIDINVKYDDYRNVTIEDSVIRGVKRDDFGNDPTWNAGIAVKARDDGGAYDGTPASLSGVTIDNVTIEDSVTGLRFGEPGVDYDGEPEGPTDVTVVDSTFSNNTDYDVEDLSDSVDLDTVSEQNTFDNVVTTDNAIYSTIQPAVGDAEPGDIIEASSGTYDGFEITTRNVTVAGNRTGTIIEGIVYLSAQNSELSNTTVAPPTFDDEVNNRTNQAVLVTATGATVDDNNIDITVSDPTEGFNEGQAVQVFNSDGDPISDVVISDNIITGEGVNGFPGVVGVNDQANTEKTLIVNNDIAVTSPGYSFGVVSRASESATSTPSSEVLFNDITATGGELNGVGYGIESNSQAQIDADEQLVKYNKFEEIDAIEHKAADGTLDLTINAWEDPSDVQFLTEDEIFSNSQNGGQIVYDPVLTEEKSVNRFDELLTETDTGETVATTDDYGSFIEVETNGEPVAIGFPARPDGDLGEILPDDIGSGVSIFVYDNTAPADENGFRQPGGDIANYTPEAGEVIVITGSPISAEFVVPIDNAVEGNAAGLPAQTEIREGWNLVATGAAGDISTIDSTSDIVLSTQIQTQPTQPGAPPVPGDSPIGAYEGTWLFVSEDGFIAPGYAPGQPPSVYTEFVLATEAENDEN